MAKNSKSGSLLERIDTRSLTDSIMAQLEEKIISGGLAEGEKLPSEQVLSEQAQVGRRAVREALKALEMKGLVEIRKGSGTFVTRNDLDSYIEMLVRNVQAYLHLDRVKLRHLLQYRELLTGGIISMLARNPDAEAITALEESIAEQSAAYRKKNNAAYTRAHIRFHTIIVESLDNPVATMMYSQIVKLLEPTMKRAAGKLEIMKSAIREHQQILDAIKSGDATRAQHAFHSHMELSMANLEKML